MKGNEQQYKIQIVGPSDTGLLKQQVSYMWSESLLVAHRKQISEITEEEVEDGERTSD